MTANYLCMTLAPHTGYVQLSITRPLGCADRLHFSVVDTGPGIAPEEHDALFGVFQQTQSGHESMQGTGLGVAISKKYAELLGGELRVRSDVGQGTEFSFEIQLHPADLEQRGRLSQETVHWHPARQVGDSKVLVVDDQESNREILGTLLRAWGFLVQEACDGEEALMHWEAWRPDLIFMDLRMPRLNGHEAIRRIRAREEGAHTRIVAVTANAFEDDRRCVLQAGGDAFLRKPFLPQQVMDNSFSSPQRNFKSYNTARALERYYKHLQRMRLWPILDPFSWRFGAGCWPKRAPDGLQTLLWASQVV